MGFRQNPAIEPIICRISSQRGSEAFLGGRTGIAHLGIKRELDQDDFIESSRQAPIALGQSRSAT
jgi:hypothetical protein